MLSPPSMKDFTQEELAAQAKKETDLARCLEKHGIELISATQCGGTLPGWPMYGKMAKAGGDVLFEIKTEFAPSNDESYTINGAHTSAALQLSPLATLTHA